MLNKLWKWILAIIGVACFIIFGRKILGDSQDERAWNKYQKKKKKFDEEKEKLNAENETDQARIKEIDKEIEKNERKLIKRTAQAKEEIKNIDNMSAEEVANVTTEQESRLADRLGLDI